MYLIVGIGNPGDKYSNTPHNVGFNLVEHLAGPNGWKKMQQSLICKTEIQGHPVVLVKPIAYVNLSGQALKPVANFFKVPIEKIIVMVDDVNLPMGSVRIRSKGSHGGHNGLRDIINHFGDQFPRVRIGVGLCPPQWNLSNWVLKKLNSGEKDTLDNLKSDLEPLILCGIQEGWDKASSKFNKKAPE